MLSAIPTTQLDAFLVCASPPAATGAVGLSAVAGRAEMFVRAKAHPCSSGVRAFGATVNISPH